MIITKKKKKDCASERSVKSTSTYLILLLQLAQSSLKLGVVFRHCSQKRKTGKKIGGSRRRRGEPGPFHSNNNEEAFNGNQERVSSSQSPRQQKKKKKQQQGDPRAESRPRKMRVKWWSLGPSWWLKMSQSLPGRAPQRHWPAGGGRERHSGQRRRLF